jgi:peptide/nickel transport system substrate-binding protein
LSGDGSGLVRLRRRSLLLGALGGFFAPRVAFARGRTPIGGKFSMRVPFPLASIDPHRLDDAGAAIFETALFDSLYAQESGQIVPSLAEGDPEPDGASLRVKLRGGLRSARGKPIGTKDVVASIVRAKGSGAKGWLADIPTPREDGRSLLFAMKDGARLTRALASPLVAIVPASFTADAPDGTGPFKVAASGDGFVFSRNAFAARGPAFLDEVIVRVAPDVSATLRAFESGADDVAWFERGLHEPRARSLAFDFGAVALAVLFTGKDAVEWDAPGVAQGICDSVPHSALAGLKVGTSWTTGPNVGWGAPPAPLYVREDSAWLVECAKNIAAIITRPSHEITAKPVSASEIAQRRASRSHALLLDIVRPFAPNSLGAMVALATADDPARAAGIIQHPPKLGDVSARTLTRTLRVGVAGEIRVQGGRMPEIALAASTTGSGLDLGATWRARAR